MGRNDGPYSSHSQRLRLTSGLGLREFLTHLPLILLKSELADKHRLNQQSKLYSQPMDEIDLRSQASGVLDSLDYDFTEVRTCGPTRSWIRGDTYPHPG